MFGDVGSKRAVTDSDLKECLGDISKVYFQLGTYFRGKLQCLLAGMFQVVLSEVSEIIIILVLDFKSLLSTHQFTGSVV